MAASDSERWSKSRLLASWCLVVIAAALPVSAWAQAGAERPPVRCQGSGTIEIPPQPPQVDYENSRGSPPPEPAYGPTILVRGWPGPSVKGFGRCKDVAVGTTHGCAVTQQGKVGCWTFQYGVSTKGPKKESYPLVATMLPELRDVMQIAAGMLSFCALHKNGSVTCWRVDQNVRLEKTVLSRIEGITGARNLTMHPWSNQACVATEKGTLACWGDASLPALGIPANIPGRAAEAPGLNGVVMGAFAQTHMCALLQEGSVRCWGWGDKVASPDFPAPAKAVAIAAADGPVTCALLADGSVRCWGQAARLGTGATTGELVSEPRSPTGLKGVVSLSMGVGHACAVLKDGTARCWGANEGAAIGDGTFQFRTEPVEVCTLKDAVDLSAGQHTCALLKDGSIRCWGYIEGARRE